MNDDHGVLLRTNESKKIALKRYEKLLNTEFARNKNNLSEVGTVYSVHRLINKEIVRESISKMNHGMAAGPSGLVSETVKPAEDAEINMITDLINQITEGVAPAEWKHYWQLLE